MTDDIHGFHHTGIVTRDLDGLERTYTSLGFTLSPRSRHLLNARPGEPPVPGCTANRCALFGGAYIELLGIVDDSAPDPWHTKAMVEEYEGFRLLNFDTGDAEATDRRLSGAGLRTSGVLDLERDVDTEDGTRTMRARAVHLDPRSTPEGHVGIAQHLTRHYVHQPRYLHHPNGARAMEAVLLVVDDAAFEAAVSRYARILQTAPGQRGPRTVLDRKAGRLEIIRSSDAEEVLPGEPVPAASYPAAMTIVVDDAAAARTFVEGAGTATRTVDDGFFVSARHACGAGLFFTAR
ncbi:VOC family protein [Actinomadura viridis]|uniref:Catechol 2,3-dioxygenase-like lactoylglutathione lyase family enzyme n=1 Tax=Actinomadura viridis TaxID=58110 RepID=A0A931GQR5_9ACTN|nr:VOC family protein [Actinomadura viridis]MBG6092031.1 catechol 2,3-dioxygenase-like lactoylglutathione lyase family enzyme [Actinomadura viridis]